jgi:RNA processing factor Prp31
MGQEISEFDIECLKDLCVKTLRMFEFRKNIQ